MQDIRQQKSEASARGVARIAPWDNELCNGSSWVRSRTTDMSSAGGARADPRDEQRADLWTRLGGGVPPSEKRGSAPKGGRHSTIIVSTTCICAVAAWWFKHPHQQVVPTVGAGFLGAPPIFLTHPVRTDVRAARFIARAQFCLDVQHREFLGSLSHSRALRPSQGTGEPATAGPRAKRGTP